ncbi:MAG: transposase [Brevundimonas sp.]|nr:transposase [Brevundimonas sp.]
MFKGLIRKCTGLKSGRQFAALLGMTPWQRSTGVKQRARRDHQDG